jgi:hypothetical protein
MGSRSSSLSRFLSLQLVILYCSVVTFASMSKLTKFFIPIFVLLCSCVYFFLVLGWSYLDPTNAIWLLDGDHAAHYFGWAFVRHQDWSFPLAFAPDLLHPSGTYAAFTDSVPVASALFQALNPILPPVFQFAGIWFLMSFVLQGYFAGLLLREFKLPPLFVVLGSLLFVMSPPMLFRYFHVSLVAHWAIIAALWNYVRAVHSRHPLPHPLAVFALFVASGIQPYLAVMVFALVFVQPLAVWLVGSGEQRVRCLLGSFIAVITLVGGFKLFGYFEGASYKEVGFEAYATDLTAFINPMRTSRLIPTLPTGAGQYEGYAYLGLGVILLLVVVAKLYRGERLLSRLCVDLRWRLLALAVAGMYLYALSGRIRFANKWILSLRFLYEPLGSLTSTFRSSGRFCWPAYYVILSFAIVAFARSRLSRRTKSLLFVGFFALQIVDVMPLYHGHGFRDQRATLKVFDPKPVLPTDRDFSKVILVPPQIFHYACVTKTLGSDWYIPYSFYAALNGLSINAGSVSRTAAEQNRYCEDFSVFLQSGPLDREAIYVLHPELKQRFLTSFKDLVSCYLQGGHQFCVAL